jgi:hypothetical protein
MSTLVTGRIPIRHERQAAENADGSSKAHQHQQGKGATTIILAEGIHVLDQSAVFKPGTAV